MKKLIILFSLFMTTVLMGADSTPQTDKNQTASDIFSGSYPIPLPPVATDEETKNDYAVPEINKSGENIDGNELRRLEHTYTVMLEAKVDLYIPLEVITDIDINATIVGNQIKEIPFDIELNRKPEKKDYYVIKYSESVIDIDNDGKPDTYINSPKFVNERVTKDNYVKIIGENISKEGEHTKDVYITIEVGDPGDAGK